MQGHGLTDDPAEDDEEGGYEEGDLHGAADCDVDGQIHLALVCYDHCGNVLSGVSDDGQENETDEGLADMRSLHNGIDAVDEVFGAYGDHDCDDDEGDAGSDWGEDLTGFIFFRILVLDVVEEIVVAEELEIEIQKIQDQKNDCCSVGEDENVLVR